MARNLDTRRAVVPTGELPDEWTIGDRRAVGDAPADAVDPPLGWTRTQQVRRRVLNVQLARLAFRLGDTDLAALDAAARTVRLASRLERNELTW